MQEHSNKTSLDFLNGSIVPIQSKAPKGQKQSWLDLCDIFSCDLVPLRFQLQLGVTHIHTSFRERACLASDPPRFRFSSHYGLCIPWQQRCPDFPALTVAVAIPALHPAWSSQ